MSPSGNGFDVLPEQTLLESGLSGGVALPFGCANGSCGDCQARILEGTVKTLRHHDFVLTEAQKLNGFCLLCSTTATSDVQIEVLEATSVGDIPNQQLRAKLCRVEQIDNIIIVAFKFVRGKALRFLPGQSVRLTLPDGDAADLPIASCPCNAQFVEFHVLANDTLNLTPAKFAEKLLTVAATRERVNINGPIGRFTLSTANQKPQLFIANGQDFNQLQGMIEQVLNTDLGTPCCLVWRASEYITQYRSNLCRSWHDAIDEFDYVPVASTADVLNALPEAWLSRLDECEVYLGTQDLALIEQLQSRGVETTSIFYPRQLTATEVL